MPSFSELLGKLKPLDKSEIAYQPAIGLNKEGKADYFWSDDIRDFDAIDTVVIHSMYAKDAEGDDQYSTLACLEVLNSLGLSTHYFIDRLGKVTRSVDEIRQAWQAGKSKMPSPDAREGVNLFSVGIELIGREEDGFTDEQYISLVGLVAQIMGRLPIRSIVGHSDIATAEVRAKVGGEPKTDPGVNFDWELFANLLLELVGEERLASMTYLKGKDVYLWEENRENDGDNVSSSGDTGANLDTHYW